VDKLTFLIKVAIVPIWRLLHTAESSRFRLLGRDNRQTTSNRAQLLVLMIRYKGMMVNMLRCTRRRGVDVPK
ncbi:MAG: hypothetical protein SGPRY_009893, partial [Prymnesium sp.]